MVEINFFQIQMLITEYLLTCDTTPIYATAQLYFMIRRTGSLRTSGSSWDVLGLRRVRLDRRLSCLKIDCAILFCPIPLVVPQPLVKVKAVTPHCFPAQEPERRSDCGKALRSHVFPLFFITLLLFDRREPPRQYRIVGVNVRPTEGDEHNSLKLFTLLTLHEPPHTVTSNHARILGRIRKDSRADATDADGRNTIAHRRVENVVVDPRQLLFR